MFSLEPIFCSVLAYTIIYLLPTWPNTYLETIGSIFNRVVLLISLQIGDIKALIVQACY